MGFRETLATMSTALSRKLLVITGKGGAGKTTVSAATGLLAASRGLRTIVVEVGERQQLPALFGLRGWDAGVEHQLDERLWSLSIDPDRALLEWLQVLGGRISGRMLATSSTFQYFSAAAPGAKELVSMVKIWELTQSRRWRRAPAGYDLVVVDAPATGHALAMLQSPRTFGAIARVGPVAKQADSVRELLIDPARSGYVAVAQPAEMAVTETIELQRRLRGLLGRELDAIVVNGVLPRRFSEQDLRALADGDEPVQRAAARAARAVHARARFQHNQLARLRRRHAHVLSLRFRFEELDLKALRQISERLGRIL